MYAVNRLDLITLQTIQFAGPVARPEIQIRPSHWLPQLYSVGNRWRDDEQLHLLANGKAQLNNTFRSRVLLGNDSDR